MDIKKTAVSRRGQNTVEYLLMLTVVVGVVLVSGGMLRKFMPTVITDITNKIADVAMKMGG
ncbi:MAG: hypothetical protein Q7J64_01500 [Elusimicrobiota bacterium]|nr:hypothetical protein [Elusimicrobiota bacterium]